MTDPIEIIKNLQDRVSALEKLIHAIVYGEEKYDIELKVKEDDPEYEWEISLYVDVIIKSKRKKIATIKDFAYFSVEIPRSYNRDKETFLRRVLYGEWMWAARRFCHQIDNKKEVREKLIKANIPKEEIEEIIEKIFSVLIKDGKEDNTPKKLFEDCLEVAHPEVFGRDNILDIAFKRTSRNLQKQLESATEARKKLEDRILGLELDPTIARPRAARNMKVYCEEPERSRYWEDEYKKFRDAQLWEEERKANGTFNEIM